MGMKRVSDFTGLGIQVDLFLGLCGNFSRFSNSELLTSRLDLPFRLKL